MFFVSQKPNIKRSPNGIKTDGELFGIFVIFGRKNQRETVPEVATRVAHATTLGSVPTLSWTTRKEVDALLLPQES